MNAKDYLVSDQGIDATRITTATGTSDDKSGQNYLVAPAGANFANDVQGTTPVNETAVKPQARKPLLKRHRQFSRNCSTNPGRPRSRFCDPGNHDAEEQFHTVTGLERRCGRGRTHDSR